MNFLTISRKQYIHFKQLQYERYIRDLLDDLGDRPRAAPFPMTPTEIEAFVRFLIGKRIDERGSLTRLVDLRLTHGTGPFEGARAQAIYDEPESDAWLKAYQLVHGVEGVSAHG